MLWKFCVENYDPALIRKVLPQQKKVEKVTIPSIVEKTTQNYGKYIVKGVRSNISLQKVKDLYNSFFARIY
jgi:hypothetical protein